MPEYLDLDLNADAPTLQQEGRDYIESQAPAGYTIDPLVDWILGAVARMAVLVIVLAGRVPRAIFRYFGVSVLKVPVNEAVPAAAAVTFTLADTDGHTIPAGSQIDIDGQGFILATDLVIAPGDDTGSIGVIAINAGSEATDLPGDDVRLVSPTFVWVDTVTLDAPTKGGIDGETDDEYVDRLADELPTLSPKAILISDFEALARRDPEVARAMARDNYAAGYNEVQKISATGPPTGGTFTLSGVGVGPTAAIPYNATAADVKAALVATGISAGDLNVTGGPVAVSGSDPTLHAAPIYIEYIGTLAQDDQPDLVADDTAITSTIDPTASGIAAETIIDGQPASGSELGTVTVAIQDDDGEAVSLPARGRVKTSLEADRVLPIAVSVIDPTYTEIDVAFTATAYDDADPAEVKASGEAAVAAFLDPAAWGDPGDGSWVNETILRRLDLAGVLHQVPGLRHLTALTLAEHGDALGTGDVTLAGDAALPRPITITGTVT